jgi:hypothetical protein
VAEFPWKNAYLGEEQTFVFEEQIGKRTERREQIKGIRDF